MQVRSGKPALQNGLLFGTILGILEIALNYVLRTPGFFISVLLFLFMIGYAGYRASSRTDKVSTGLVAGLLAGLLSSVLASIPLLVYFLSNIDALRVQLQQQMTANNLDQGIPITNNIVIASVILFLVVVVAAATLLGLGIGSIGGAIGKAQAAPSPVPRYPYNARQPYPPQEYISPQPQGYAPHPSPQAQQPFTLSGDYTSPEAYMLPQEKTPPTPPTQSGPYISQE
jgi:hypothetical protein